MISEEDGGLGAFATHDARAPRRRRRSSASRRAAGVVVANAGALTFELRVRRPRGPREHAAQRPQRARRVPADPRRPRASSSGGATTGRTGSSTAPRCPTRSPSARSAPATGRAACPTCSSPRGDSGVQLGEDPAQARAELVEAIADGLPRRPVAARQPASRSRGTAASSRAGCSTRRTRSSPRSSGRSSRSSTATRSSAGAPYGSDLRVYAGIGGIPTLHYGPGDVRYAHAPREQVDIAELLATTRTLALLAARRCGAHR